MIILFGFLSGIALGLTGGGGSILAVPLLIYGLHLSFHQAVTISLIVVSLTALVGFIPKLKTGEIELSAGIILAITGMIFAPIGSYISQSIPSHILLLSFACLMLFIGIWTLIKTKVLPTKANKNASCHYLPNGKLSLTLKCKSVLLISGIVTGLLTGFFGVGGGFLIVPALILAAKMPIKKAITTSLLIIFLVSISGFISHIRETSINWQITILFILGSSIGMLIALRLKHKINDQILQRLFSLIVIAFGVIILIIKLNN